MWYDSYVCVMIGIMVLFFFYDDKLHHNTVKHFTSTHILNYELAYR